MAVATGGLLGHDVEVAEESAGGVRGRVERLARAVNDLLGGARGQRDDSEASEQQSVALHIRLPPSPKSAGRPRSRCQVFPDGRLLNATASSRPPASTAGYRYPPIPRAARPSSDPCCSPCAGTPWASLLSSARADRAARGSDYTRS